MARKLQGRPLSGILLLDKAPGCTSNRALQQVKRLYTARKAGHTGSLDPLATGMLPVCFGDATRVCSFLLDADKAYQTSLRLGITTDSGDADGEITARLPVPARLDRARLDAVLAGFLGKQQQIPPMFSALKVDGQRLHALARQGRQVAREARTIAISELVLLAVDGPVLHLEVRCSKGTYIRTLANDIGSALGYGAHVTNLRRLHVAPFEYCDMHRIVDLESLAPAVRDALLLPIDAALLHLPAATLEPASAVDFCHGRTALGRAGGGPSSPPQLVRYPAESRDNSPWRIYDAAGRLLGIGAPSGTPTCRILRYGEPLAIAPQRVLHGSAQQNPMHC